MVNPVAEIGIWALYMKGDHAPTFTSFNKVGFVDGILFRSRFPRVAAYLFKSGPTTVPGTPLFVPDVKVLETSISWNPSAATISQAFCQGLLM